MLVSFVSLVSDTVRIWHASGLPETLVHGDL